MRELRNIYSNQNNAQTAGDTEIHVKSKAVELVDRAASGDLKAFGELYSIYLDQIYRYVFYRVRNKMIAEDITEEVFIKAWKSINSCKGKGDTFLSWLYRIAHNQVVDDFRSRRKEDQLTETENLADVSAIESGVEEDLEWQELSALIATLPQSRAQVITMKFIEGLDNHEIGRVMGKSQGAIRVLQMRALTMLRQKLSGEK